MSLQDAVEVLRDLTNARPVENRSRLIAGALGLSTITYSCADWDPANAAIGLQLLATVGTLDLDETGRRRAAFLAVVVDGLILSRSGLVDDPGTCRMTKRPSKSLQLLSRQQLSTLSLASRPLLAQSGLPRI